MSHPNDLRLIEDYLPIEAISAEASREKSVRKGHISTLHLWWARRPLVACRAAVYGSLVPADRWVKDLNVRNTDGHDPEAMQAFKKSAKHGLNRKAAKDFVTKLCRYPKTDPTKESDKKIKRETEAAIFEAQRHILEAHADRLTAELAEAKKSGKPPAWVTEFKFKGDKVTYDDIIAGRAPRPRVLDMFAGGGAIPLEALRLGCEAYALDLNPVAHIIQLCTLVYPQKYGKPDPAVRGMTGPKNKKGETTWGGLAAEVRYWGNWVLDRVRKEIGDLYPPIPDPDVWATPPEVTFDRKNGEWKVTEPGKPKRGVKLESRVATKTQRTIGENDGEDDEDGNPAAAPVHLPPGFLQPVAYLWTRTVRCKNPKCGAIVPLVKQTWLCRKRGRAIAVAVGADKRSRRLAYTVVEAESEREIEFDPAAFSEAGNATCLFCGTVADADFVQEEGKKKRISKELMALACLRPAYQGKVYIAPSFCAEAVPTSRIEASLADFLKNAADLPDGPINPIRPSPNARGLSAITRYGYASFGQLFENRQSAFLLTLARAVANVGKLLEPHASIAVQAYLAVWIDRLADKLSSFTRWDNTRENAQGTWGKHALPMVWDFVEPNPLAWSSGGASGALGFVTNALDALVSSGEPAIVSRGSATSLPFPNDSFDSVVTDPPYYDNIPYADIADFFYIWLKRSIGNVLPEHFSSQLTPKKSEATALSGRHAGDMRAATREYEELMLLAFRDANRVLKAAGALCVVYAHKTTLGWSTLVDALRTSGFVVVEAWPLDTEMKARMVATDAAALASSITLVARKRKSGAGTGNYEDDVQPDLQQIVRERVETLWEMGIAGADLVIACVGAGLRAFTKYEKVEYANGDEVPAEKFLAEVEGVVLDTMMGKLFGHAGGKVSAIDPASRFYILWRFVYKTTEIEAGEAIVFTYAQHVELDGPQGLSVGKDALVEKKKAMYRARDFTERGNYDKLGLPGDDGQPAPLIDALHRILWLMENSPRKLSDFLIESDLNRERLRVLAQALAGAALSGKTEEDASKLVGTTPAEKAALGKLLSNWRTVVESTVESPKERAERKSGQKRLFE